MRHQPAIGGNRARHALRLRRRIKRSRHCLVTRRFGRGQQSATQRRPRHRGEAEHHRLIQLAIFKAGDTQRADFRLGRNQLVPKEMVERGGLRARKVRHAQAAHLARCHRIIEHAGDLLRVREDIGAVDLPQINVIHLQPGERIIDCLAQIIRALIIGQRGQYPALGGEHHLPAQSRLCRQHFAQQRLGIAKPSRAVKTINIGGVEERDPGIERRVHQPCCITRSAPVFSEAPHAPGNR